MGQRSNENASPVQLSALLRATTLIRIQAMKFVLLITLIGCIIAVAIIAARYRSSGSDR